MKNGLALLGIALIMALSLLTFAYADQTPAARSTDAPALGSGQSGQSDADTGIPSGQSKKHRKSGESSMGVDKDRGSAGKGSQGEDFGMGSGSKSEAPASKSKEGSNPTLDKSGKGSASRG